MEEADRGVPLPDEADEGDARRAQHAERPSQQLVARRHARGAAVVPGEHLGHAAGDARVARPRCHRRVAPLHGCAQPRAEAPRVVVVSECRDEPLRRAPEHDDQLLVVRLHWVMPHEREQQPAPAPVPRLRMAAIEAVSHAHVRLPAHKCHVHKVPRRMHAPAGVVEHRECKRHPTLGYVEPAHWSGYRHGRIGKRRSSTTARSGTAGTTVPSETSTLGRRAHALDAIVWAAHLAP